MSKHDPDVKIHCYCLEDIESERDKLKAALEKITKVSQFNREGGPIVMSEHYEAAWLDCIDIAEAALKEK